MNNEELRVKFHALVESLVVGRGAEYNGQGEHDSIALAERLYATLTGQAPPDGYLFMRCLKFSRSYFAEQAGRFQPDSLLDDAGYSLLRSRRRSLPVDEGERSLLQELCVRRHEGAQ